MDARLLKVAILVSTFTSLGATYRTPNFVVHAPTPEAAEKVGRTAEHFRKELAIAWLGKELPQWYRPCPIEVKVGQIGAGGATTFSFDRGEVFGWNMRVQGSLERILDSVVPHEVSHTIFACHFRRPLPRWADEGAATLIEHASEKRRQQMTLKQVWNTQRRMPLRRLLSIKEYPRDMRNVMTLYAQGFSLADFLVQAGGKRRYLKFLNDAHRHGWDQAIAANYDVEGVDELERRWSGWVVAGSPPLKLPEGQQLADADRKAQNQNSPVIRSQSPDSPQPREKRNVPSTRPRRNLSAPQPAGDRLAQNQGSPRSPKRRPSPAASPAEEMAMNDGWNAIPEKRRLPRPAPLATRIPYSAADGPRQQRPGDDVNRVGDRFPN